MTTATSQGQGTAWLATAARVALGAFFIYSGVAKTLNPAEFLKLLRLYEITDIPAVLTFIAAALPWFETFCGLLLLTGVAVRGTALVALAMLAPFTVVVLRRALALQAAESLPFCAVRFDCGCGMGEVGICAKLLENGILIALAAGLIFAGNSALAIRHALIRSRN
jgi:uncharacterized membrane protein YphA (DoxX/SURF4 family)